MGAINRINLEVLTTPDLFALCQSMGLSFGVVDGEKLKVMGNLATLDPNLKAAIQAHRDELLALVFCIEHGINYVDDIPNNAADELDSLINCLCDQVSYTYDQRMTMLNARKIMRPMDIPACIEHFKQCLWHVENGTYWAYKAKAN